MAIASFVLLNTAEFFKVTYTGTWGTFLQHLIFINQLVWVFYQCKHYEQKHFYYLLNFPKSTNSCGTVAMSTEQAQLNSGHKVCDWLVANYRHTSLREKLRCKDILWTAKNSKELPYHYHRPKISRSCQNRLGFCSNNNVKREEKMWGMLFI